MARGLAVPIQAASESSTWYFAKYPGFKIKKSILFVLMFSCQNIPVVE